VDTKIAISLAQQQISCDKICQLIQMLVSKNSGNKNLSLLTIELKEVSDDINLIPKIENNQ
jgi:hypothetical protein